MKYRSDFVTNSSSSSFIVTFKNNADKEEQYRIMAKAYPQYCKRVFQDIEKERVTYTEALKYMKQYASYLAYTKLKYDSGLYRVKSPEYFRSDEFKEKVQVETTNIIKNFIENVNHRGQFAIVTYNDHLDSELEGNIMPKMPFVFQSFNWH